MTVDLLGLVAYANGNGPISGFLSFGFHNGAMRVCQYSGKATHDSARKSTIQGQLEVISGTRRFALAQG